MSFSAQNVEIVVVDKATAVTRHDMASDLTLSDASVVKIKATRSDVKEFNRLGNDLEVRLHSGEIITIRNFYVKFSVGVNHLVLQDDSDALWLVVLGDTEGAGPLAFSYSALASIDPLLLKDASEEPLVPVFAAWGAAVIGSLLAGSLAKGGSSGSGASGEVPPKPEVNPVNGKDPITGKAEPGTTVTVHFPSGEKVLAQVGSDGQFSVKNPGLNHNEQIKVVATNGAGMDSEPTYVVVDAQAPARPIVDPVNGKDPITGTAEPGSTVTVKFPDGSTQTATAGEDGAFKVPNPGAGAGVVDKAEVVVTATDGAGNTSGEVKVPVDAVAPLKPNVDPINGKDPITGTAEPGSTVTVEFPDGSTQTTTAGEDGAFTVPNPGAGAGVVDKAEVVITATDGAGNTSGEVKVPVDTLAPAQPEVNPVNGKDPITGTAEPGSTVTVIFPDGSTGTATAGEDGSFKVPNPGEGAGVVDKAEVVVTATDGAGNTSGEVKVPVDAVAPLKPNVDPINGKDPITGTAEPGSTVTVEFPDGSTQTTTAGEDGAFTVPNPGAGAGVVDQAEVAVTATDGAGNTSEEAKVTVDAVPPEQPIVNPIDTTAPITGIAEPESTVTVTFPDGTTQTTTADKDGSFSVPNAGEHGGVVDQAEITVTATDPAGNESEPTTVVVDAFALMLSITDDVAGVAGVGQAVTFTVTFNKPVNDFDATDIVVTGGTAGTFTAVSSTVYTFVAIPPAGAVGELRVTIPEGAAHDALGKPSGTVHAVQLFDTKPPTAGDLYQIELWDDVGPVQGLIQPGNETDDNRPTYKGKANTEEVAFVEILNNGQVIGKVPVQPDGSWSFEPEQFLGAGAHSFQARPVDVAGNVGPATDPIGFTLVGSAPDAPAIEAVEDGSGTITGPLQKGETTDDTTPTLSGTAQPGTTVTIHDVVNGGRVPVGSAETGEDGRWSITTKPLGEGPHELVATATDKAGQPSVDTGVYPLVVDTTPPARQEVPQAVDNFGEVQGPIQPGGTTDDATPTLSGQGEPGSTVTIKDNGKELGSVPVDGDGNWSFTPPTALEDGPHSITATPVDAAGNVGQPSEPLVITVDTTGVELMVREVLDNSGTVDKPIAEGGATKDSTPVFVGKATPGATVTIHEGGKEIARTQADGQGAWRIELPVQTDGAHQYVVKAKSPAGSESEVRHGLTVDTTPSSVPSITGVMDDVGSKQNNVATGGFSDDTTPTILGTGVPGDTIHVFYNGEPAGSTTVDAEGQWQYTVHPSLKSEGEYQWTATSVDAVGNESAHSAPYITHLDTTAPSLKDAQLTVDPVAGDNYVNIEESQGQVVLTGKLTGIPEDADQTVITVTVNGKPFEAQLEGENWSVSVPGAQLVAGGDGPAQLQVEAQVSDAAGNTETLTQTHDFHVKTTPIPQVWEKVEARLYDDVEPGLGEITHGMHTNDSKPVYKGTVHSSAGVAFVEVLDNGKVIGKVPVQPDGSWSFEPAQGLGKGEHSFQARPVDVAGNVGTGITPAIVFTLEGAQPLPPAIESVEDGRGTITGPLQKGEATDDTTPTLSGTAQPGTTVTIYDLVDGNRVPVGTAEVGEDGQWSITTTPLGEGPHELVATATDKAGQPSVDTGVYPLVVDTTPPAKQEVPQAVDNFGEVQGPIQPGGTTDDATPTLSGQGEPGSTVTIKDNGKELGSVPVDGDGNWSFTPPTALEDGPHSITATPVDAAGNVGQPSEPLVITVDTTGVELMVREVLDNQGPVAKPIADGGATNDPTPLFVGKATPGATVTIHEAGQEIARTQADAQGEWRVELPAQAEGAHQYVVKAQSTTGSLSEVPHGLTVDLTPSSVPVITGVSDDVGVKQSNVVPGGSSDDTTPTILGTGVPGDTIQVFYNGLPAGTTTVDANGQWQYTVHPSLKSEGEYQWTATSVDAVGNESAHSAPYITYLDTTAPRMDGVRLTVEPVAGDNYVNAEEAQGPVLLTGQLTGLPQDVEPGSTKVTVTVNGKDYDAQLNGQSWSVSVPGSQLAAGGDGPAKLVVKASVSDPAGNAGELQIEHGFHVKTSPIPENWEKTQARLYDDVEPGLGEITHGMHTNDSKPVYKGTVHSSAGVAFVEVLDNGTVIGKVPVQPDGSWSFEPQDGLGKGEHSFQARPVDVAGNVGTGITPAIGFTLEGAQPMPPAIESVEDGSGTITGPIQKGSATDDTTPTLSGTAQPGTTVTVYDLANGNRVPVGTAEVGEDGRWSITTSPLGEGPHELVANATDKAGQPSVDTGGYPLVVDTTPPAKQNVPQAVDNVGNVQGPITPGTATDDTTPTLSGQGEPGSTVTIKDNGKELGSVPVDGSGNWSFTPPTALEDGPHSITATPVDAAGNVGQPSDPLVFTVDTADVELMVREVLDNEGAVAAPIANGGATKDSTPVFVGKATPGATVTIQEGGVEIARTQADGQGEWRVELPVQPEGAHQYVVQAESTTGSKSEVPFGLTVDTTPPNIPVITGVMDDVGAKQSLVASGGSSDDTTPSIQGTGAPGDVIKVFQNGQPVGNATVDASGKWQYTVTPSLQSEGEYKWTATSVDAVGNESAHSAPYITYLDTTAPNLDGTTLTVDPVTGDNQVSTAEAQGNVTLSGKLTGLPQDVDPASVKVTVMVDGKPHVAQLNGQNWSVSVPGSQLVAGGDGPAQLQVKVTASDQAGNAQDKTFAHGYEVKVGLSGNWQRVEANLWDDEGIVVGVIMSGTRTDDRTPTYSGEVLASAGVNAVEVLNYGQVIGTAQVQPDGKWAFEPAAGLAPGYYSFQARPVDSAGNRGEPSPKIIFQVLGELAPPTIEGIEPEDDAMDADMAPKGRSLANELQLPQDGPAPVAPMSRAMPMAAPLQGFAEEPGKNAILTNNPSPLLRGGVFPESTVMLFKVTESGQWVRLGITKADEGGVWKLKVHNLVDGLHELIAIALNDEGQESGPSLEFTLHVDTIAPDASQMPHGMDNVGTVQGTIAFGGYTDDARPVFSGQGEAGAKVTVYNNGQEMGSTVVAYNGQWQFQPATELPHGAHSVSVKFTDAAGNTSKASPALSFTVDPGQAQQPGFVASSTMRFCDNVGIKQFGHNSGDVTDDRTPMLFGKLNSALKAGEVLAIFAGGQKLGEATFIGEDWRFNITEPLAHGASYLYTAKIVGASGAAVTVAELQLSVALTISVKTQSTQDVTPVITGSIGSELLAGEYVEVSVNGRTYSSRDGQVAVDLANSLWSLQLPTAHALAQGSHKVTVSLHGQNGQAAVTGVGSLNIEAPAQAHANWATAAGDAANNTLTYGVNSAGLWTMSGNQQVFSSTDMSSYSRSALPKLAADSGKRAVGGMTMADVDRNGTAEIISASASTATTGQVMWKSSGNSYVAQKLESNGNIHWGGVIAYDKTGDGYLDLAYGDRSSWGAVYLANNKGSLGVDYSANGNVFTGSHSANGEISGVDINNSGSVDIVFHESGWLANYLTVLNNNGKGSLSTGQYFSGVFYQNEKNTKTTASMTWADFNGDGYMDLYLATGLSHTNGAIYYNNGKGQLETTAMAVEAQSTKIADAGFLSVAVDWNHDGRMDVVKFTTSGASQMAKLSLNQVGNTWVTSVLANSLSYVTGIAALDYNWDGARDLIVSQQDGKMVYIQNHQAIAKGTAMHLRIVDSEGINVYYGNTVQLFDAAGKLVAAQIINPQSGYGVNDSSALVTFYGLDPSQTYTAKLLKVTNGTTAHVSWQGLTAGDGAEAYVLTADAATNVRNGKLVGTGYDDTFVAEKGVYSYNGGGGWTEVNGEKVWNAKTGMDIIDFQKSQKGISIHLGQTGPQATGFNTATLVSIEGVRGSNFDDVIVGSSSNNLLEGRGGNDHFLIGTGGKDTLMYRTLNKADATGGNGRDEVTGFKVGVWNASLDADRIDLSDLLVGYKPAQQGDSAASYINGVATINAGDRIQSYLKVESTETSTELFISRQGDGVNYSSLLTLNGVQTDLATLLANQQITLV